MRLYQQRIISQLCAGLQIFNMMQPASMVNCRRHLAVWKKESIRLQNLCIQKIDIMQLQMPGIMKFTLKILKRQMRKAGSYLEIIKYLDFIRMQKIHRLQMQSF